MLIGYEEDRTLSSSAGRDTAGGREAVARAYLRIRQDVRRVPMISAEGHVWGIRGFGFGLR